MIIRTTYSASISVALPHFVRCANCSCQYVYERTYTGIGQSETFYDIGGESRQREAGELARDALDTQLNDPELFDTVPCPQCLHYQPYMRARVCRERYAGLLGCGVWSVGFIGLLALGFAVIWYGAGGMSEEFRWLRGIGLVALFVATLFLVVHWWLVKKYEPNLAAPEERETLARERACSPSEYDQKQVVRVREAYYKHLARQTENARNGRRERAGREERAADRPWEKRSEAESSRTPREPKSLVVEWWLVPSVFFNSGTFVVPLSETESVAVEVTADAEPGDVFDVKAMASNVTPFKVRLFAMRVHPDEYRTEDEPG